MRGFSCLFDARSRFRTDKFTPWPRGIFARSVRNPPVSLVLDSCAVPAGRQRGTPCVQGCPASRDREGYRAPHMPSALCRDQPASLRRHHLVSRSVAWPFRWLGVHAIFRAPAGIEPARAVACSPGAARAAESNRLRDPSSGQWCAGRRLRLPVGSPVTGTASHRSALRSWPLTSPPPISLGGPRPVFPGCHGYLMPFSADSCASPGLLDSSVEDPNVGACVSSTNHFRLCPCARLDGYPVPGGSQQSPQGLPVSPGCHRICLRFSAYLEVGPSEVTELGAPAWGGSLNLVRERGRVRTCVAGIRSGILATASSALHRVLDDPLWPVSRRKTTGRVVRVLLLSDSTGSRWCVMLDGFEPPTSRPLGECSAAGPHRTSESSEHVPDC